ncbi:MAG: enoyl-CoA hydratase/isomerase family protein [Chitinophagaceae bacterium]|nr:enoyl-CoA hydratase/isomerase family protein [Oligoflexus sp.]
MADSLAAYLHFIPLLGGDGKESEFRMATLVLNRPDAANAFSGDLLVRITELLQDVKRDPTVRLLTLQGSGKHFSAGADLHWMKASALLNYEGNLQEAKKLSNMFETLAELKIPTIAIIKGAVFGGAVGLLAACDYAFACDSSKVCLSEAKIGLIPAVILPYLQRKIPAASLHRMVMGSPILTSDQVLKLGLVQEVAPTAKGQLEQLVRSEITALLQTSPEAQSAYKTLWNQLELGKQADVTAEAIATIRASAMGQHGLQSFFQKQTPHWVVHLPEKTNILIP